MIKKILIVDDSPVARKILLSSLPADRSFEITEAYDGAAGLKCFIELVPDLTIIDLTMPIMDGMEAISKMKEIRKDALIVVCSADVQPRSIQRVMELGAYVMIKKPPNKEVIADLFSKLEAPGEGPAA